MSEGNVEIKNCTRCRKKFDALLNEGVGVVYKRCVDCRTRQREHTRVHMEQETSEQRAARLKRLSDKYHTNEAYRQYNIKVATEHRQVDSECPVCLKTMKKGSLLSHLKICKGWTVLESILMLG